MTQSEPYLSVIVPTINRVDVMDALLDSLEASNFQDFEVLIVDQNASDLLDEVVARHADRMPITHLKVCLRGAARARNYGAARARGKVLCFPDDDCVLLPDTIDNALESMKSAKVDIVFGLWMDPAKPESRANFAVEPAYLTLKRHENMFAEATMFITSELYAKFLYDESFGVGTFHGSEEAYDLILRLLKADVPIYYSPSIVFHHPLKVVDHASPGEVRRAFTYRCGLAHLCIRHRLYGKLLSRMFKVCLYLLFLCVFKRRKVRYYLAELLGLWTGIVVR